LLLALHVGVAGAIQDRQFGRRADRASDRLTRGGGATHRGRHVLEHALRAVQAALRDRLGREGGAKISADLAGLIDDGHFAADRRCTLIEQTWEYRRHQGNHRRHEQQANDETPVAHRSQELPAGDQSYPPHARLHASPPSGPAAVTLARSARDAASLREPSATMRMNTSSSLRRASSIRAGAITEASRAITAAGSVPVASVIR